MKATWLGHSALKIEGSRTILIDPFLENNPAASVHPADFTKLDIVIVTHDHSDHIGDSFAICKRTNAVLVSIYEITSEAGKQGLNVEPMNIGGTIEVKGVFISLVPALHSAGLGGTAAGVVLELDGKRIYHAGDTGLTMEMKLIGEMYKPDIAFLPIDGRFNMTPRLAAKAVELLAVPRVVPIHYDTFDLIKSSPQLFKELVGDLSDVIVIKPGETIEI